MLTIRGGGNGGAKDDIESQDWGLSKDNLIAIDIGDKGYKDGVESV